MPPFLGTEVFDLQADLMQFFSFAGFKLFWARFCLVETNYDWVKKSVSLFSSKDVQITPVFEAMPKKNATSPFGYSLGVLKTAKTTNIITSWLSFFHDEIIK